MKIIARFDGPAVAAQATNISTISIVGRKQLYVVFGFIRGRYSFIRYFGKVIHSDVALKR